VGAPHDSAVEIAFARSLGYVVQDRVAHDPNTHRFWVDEIECVGMNRGLRLCGLVDDRFYHETSSQRGHYVHQATLMVDRREPFDIDERLLGYCTAYGRYVETERPDYADDGERLTGSAELRLAGIIDRRVVRLKRRKTKRLVDFKTRTTAAGKTFTPAPWQRWQLAGYRLCEPDYRGCDIVYLCEDGNYKVVSVDADWKADRDLMLHMSALLRGRLANGDRSIFGDDNRVYENAGVYQDTT